MGAVTLLQVVMELMHERRGDAKTTGVGVDGEGGDVSYFFFLDRRRRSSGGEAHAAASVVVGIAIEILRQCALVVVVQRHARRREHSPRGRIHGTFFDLAENVSHDFLPWLVAVVAPGGAIVLISSSPRSSPNVIAQRGDFAPPPETVVPPRIFLLVHAALASFRNVFRDQRQLGPRAHVIRVKVRIVIFRQRRQIATLDLGHVGASCEAEGDVSGGEEGLLVFSIRRRRGG
mmetsp:Transcript_28271/g.48070  ORF Transcript_28271/g.48070 Transcript_28271/m.48070 type:complete len:232 (-) Transcript_28271:706-1401(-)